MTSVQGGHFIKSNSIGGPLRVEQIPSYPRWSLIAAMILQSSLGEYLVPLYLGWSRDCCY